MSNALWIVSLTISQTTNFRPFQIERVSRRQFQIWYKWQKVLKTCRKHCRKRRNCSSRAISPFPTVFSKHLYRRHVKNQGLFGKELKVSTKCIDPSQPGHSAQADLCRNFLPWINFLDVTPWPFYIMIPYFVRLNRLYRSMIM